MTVRFKCQTEYQRSYRSRSVSPQRSTIFAGLRSDHMGVSSEPCLQRRKKFNIALSCGPSHQTFNEPLLDVNPSTSPTVRPLTESEAAPGLRHTGGSSEKNLNTYGNPALRDQFVLKSQKPRKHLSALPNQQQSLTNVYSLRRKAGLGHEGQQSTLDKTEYNRQFNPKKAPAAQSPILTAHQVLNFSHSIVPPFKKNPVVMDTEYQRNFQALVPPTSQRLRKNQEYEQTPLFYTLLKRNNKGQLKNNPKPGLEIKANTRSQSSPKQGSRTLAPSNLRRHRILTEYQSRFCIPLSKIPEEDDAMASTTPQINELREQARLYRHRAWGTNFSRNHLSQLLSEHNALWEPTETIETTSDRPQSHSLDLCQVRSARPDSGRTSCLEALDLASNSGRSSKRSSALDSKNEERNQTNKSTQTNATPPQSSQSPQVGEYLPFEEDDNFGDEEGRLQTPKLKMLPIQRTHLDLTTPATGGAMLVGQLKGTDKESDIQRSGTADSVLANADTPVQIPVKPREAWSQDSTQHKCAPSPVSKPAPSQSNPLVAPALPFTVPLHCIQGTLRHPDFQHNGELGLRFKEQKCTRGCCGSDEDDRLSVMSLRSAASCSLASSVLERAQKRRDKFWGKS